jgi:hypothetical protein
MAKKKENKPSLPILPVLIVIMLIAGIVLGGVFYFRKENKLKQEEAKSASKSQEVLLTVLDGSVELTHDGDKKIIKDDSKLSKNDKVETLENSRALITFEDNSLITLDEKTQITIEASEISETDVFTKVVQSFGQTWTSVQNLAGVETDFELETPKATAAVRGTEFNTFVNEDLFDFYLEDGLVDLIIPTDEQKEDSKLAMQSGKNFKLTEDELTKLLENDELSTDELETSFEDYIKDIPEDYTETEWYIWRNKLTTNLEEKLDGDLDKLDKKRLLEYLQENKDGIISEETPVAPSSETPSTDTTYKGPRDVAVNAPTEVYSSSTVDATWTTVIPNNQVEYFLVSMGSAFGKNDVYAWTYAGKKFDGKKYAWRFSGLSLKNKTKYFVQVMAKLKDGSKTKVFYDITYTNWKVTTPPPPPAHSGNVVITGPTNGGTWGGPVNPVYGTASIANFTDPGRNTYLRIAFQDAQNNYWRRYSTYGQWQTAAYWHAPDSYNQTSSTSVSWQIQNMYLNCACSVRITVRLYDNTTNALLNTKVITVTENW